MCNPDISASTFFWEDGIRRPQPDFTLCVSSLSILTFNSKYLSYGIRAKLP